MTRIALTVMCVACLVASCSRIGRSSPSDLTTGPVDARIASVLPPRDPRRDLIGTWQIEFAGADGRRIAAGTATVRDSAVRWFPGNGVAASVTIAVEPGLSWTPLCFRPEWEMLGITPRGEGWSLDFSPRCNDSNLVADVGWSHDALRGRWSAYTFVGKADSGLFRMWRP